MQLSGDVHSTPSMGVATHILFGVLDEIELAENYINIVEENSG
jgi:hypothetical protein